MYYTILEQFAQNPTNRFLALMENKLKKCIQRSKDSNDFNINNQAVDFN